MTWDELRTDLRAFARLAHFTVEPGPDSALLRRMHAGRAFAPCTGVSLKMLALVMCWRVACWPRSTTLIVTPRLDISKRLIRIANHLMARAHEDLRARVLFVPRDEGLTCANSDIVGAVHCSSGTLGLSLPVSREPLTFLIPNVDRIPGCHLKYVPLMLSRPGTTVVVNSPRQGSIL